MKERDDRIDYVKAVLISSVLAIHVLAAHETAGTVTPFMHTARIVLYCTAIPLFFAVSGWLCRPQPICRYYRKKFVRVLVPYFILGMLARRVWSRFESAAPCRTAPNAPLRALAFSNDLMR